MRIAIIADVHGNLAALEAALASAGREGVDNIVIAGDLINGAPDSKACWQLVRSLGHPLLRGNHERYIFDLGTAEEDPTWRHERFAPAHWTASRFSREEREEMRALPLCYSHPDHPDLLIVHASPYSDRMNAPADAPDSELEPLFGESTASIMVRGHDHLPSVRRVGTRLLVNAGSVGMPLDGDPAGKYVVIEQSGEEGWRVQHRRIAYDIEATERRFHETGYLEEAGPMARLMLREIVTGRHQMTPFLRSWLGLPETRRPPFDEAVNRFLAA